MKILLDECVTKRLKQHLSEHEVFTVSNMRWNGLRNGNLLSQCVENHFDILLSIDKNLMFQQNMDNYNVTIAILNTRTSKIEELVLFMPTFKLQINSFEKYKAYLINE